MVKNALTLYKLMVLYMLDRVDFPLTKNQIGDFILEKGYTNYFTLQQVIGELIETKFVTAQSYRNRTHLKLTKEGADAVHYFESDISPEIKAEIDEYFKQNSIELRNEVSVTAEYYKSTSGEYEARLMAMDKDVRLIDLTISVPIEEIAQSICDNWEKKHQKIYQYLCKQLF
ncbi:MAG: DUF4364 family protein [Lachnospiraceae bacterium]|nr:DUF4364 family protein [Lachnospiraceae bacterium]